MRLYKLTINNHKYDVRIKEAAEDAILAEVNGMEHKVSIDAVEYLISQAMVQQKNVSPTPSLPSHPSPKKTKPTIASGDGQAVVAPIPGLVLEVLVKEGDSVSVGQALLKMEAMKMENEISAEREGVISKILVTQGDSVEQDQQLLLIGGK